MNRIQELQHESIHQDNLSDISSLASEFDDFDLSGIEFERNPRRMSEPTTPEPTVPLRPTTPEMTAHVDPTIHEPTTPEPAISEHTVHIEPARSEQSTFEPTFHGELTVHIEPSSPKQSTSEPTFQEEQTVQCEPARPEPAIHAEPTEPTITEPTTPEPFIPEPIIPEPTTSEPTVAALATPESSGYNELVTHEPATPEPTTPEPTTPEPATPESSGYNELVTHEPASPEQTKPETTTPEPTTPEPAARIKLSASSIQQAERRLTFTLERNKGLKHIEAPKPQIDTQTNSDTGRLPEQSIKTPEPHCKESPKQVRIDDPNAAEKEGKIPKTPFRRSRAVIDTPRRSARLAAKRKGTMLSKDDVRNDF